MVTLKNVSKRIAYVFLFYFFILLLLLLLFYIILICILSHCQEKEIKAYVDDMCTA